MKRFLLSLCVLLLASLPSSAQWNGSVWSGGAWNNGVWVAAAFVGPLDGLPAPIQAVALRRLLSSYTANKAVHLTCSGGTSSSGDVGFTATGDFDGAGYNTRVGTGSCKIDRRYDQSGNGNDLIQSTGASQPSITLNSTGRNRAVVTSGSGISMATTATLTAAEPFTVGVYVETTANFTSQLNFVQDGSQAFQFGHWTSVNTIYFFAGAVLQATASDSAYHAVVGLANGNSSSVNVDGTTTSGAGGSSGISADTIGSPAVNWAGNLPEVVIWASGLSAANQTAYINNLAGYY